MKGPLYFLFIIIAFLKCFDSLRTDFYSIFAPTLSWNRLKDLFGSQNVDEKIAPDSAIENDFSKTDILDSIEILNANDGISGYDSTTFLKILTRIFSGVDSSIEKYRRLLMKDGNVLFSFRNWPIGWRNHLFHMSLRPSKKTDKIIWIHLSSVTKSQLAIKIKILESKVTLEYFYRALKISTQDMQQIAPFLNSFIKFRMKNDIEVLQSLINQRNSYARDAKIHKNIKQSVQLDRIINPDKYKSKSATVRRSSSTSVTNTRYKPSSSAAARRVVRK